MATGNILSITGNVPQVSGALRTDTPSKDSWEDVAMSFMKYLSQSSSFGQNSTSTGSQPLQTTASGAADMAKQAYNSSAAKTTQVRQVSQTDTLADQTETFTGYEDQIRQVLKDELGVSDEDITKAMETLGLGFLDLVNRQNLSILVQNLTGMDVGTLFSSDTFQNIIQQVSILTEELCQNLGVTKEDLMSLAETAGQLQAEEITPSETVAEQPVAEETLQPAETAEQPVQPETAAEISTETGTAVTAAETVHVNEEPVTDADTDADAKDVASAATVTTATADDTAVRDDTESGGQEFSEDAGEKTAGDSTQGHTDIHTAITPEQSFRTELAGAVQEVTQPYTDSQADAIDLIRQVAQAARVTITAETTSMELQLTPEHLGKIYLNVFERDGVIRAQIATQTQTAKEALETQLIELRQAMSQQGIKVDAVEVTVATHEFEQNLDGSMHENAGQEEQANEAEHQKQAHRNLNLNDPDSLSGLMSEEEQLAAQIMRDNGNQIDFTA